MSEISRELFMIRINDKIAAAEVVAQQQGQQPKKKSNWKKWALGSLALAGTAAAAYAGRNHLKNFGSSIVNSAKNVGSGGGKPGILSRYGELMTGSKKKQLQGLADEQAGHALKFSEKAKKFADEANELTAQHEKKIGHLNDSVKAFEDTNPGKPMRLIHKLIGKGDQDKAFDEVRLNMIGQRDAASDEFDKSKAEGGKIFNLKKVGAKAMDMANKHLDKATEYDDAASKESLKSWGARLGTGAAALGAGYGIARATGVLPAKKQPQPQKKPGLLPEKYSFNNPQMRNAGIGAGTGGLLGAGLGYLADDRRGAVIGGLAGAGLGGYAGYNFDHLLNKFENMGEKK